MTLRTSLQEQLNMSSQPKIYVVDNGGQWTHRIWRVLRELECETKITPNTTPISELDCDALVLSGGAPRIAWESPRLGSCMEYVKAFKGPILGICVGHQLIAVFYGGKAGPSAIPEFGLAKIKVNEEDDLFKDVPKEFLAWESHNDEVKAVKDFQVLAQSDNCSIQAIKHLSKPHYGIQFHPEVTNTQFGQQIYRNFVKIVKHKANDAA
jgi:GMP synthase (glutamine-hydrolysing)